jgi:hypothetical protein
MRMHLDMSADNVEQYKMAKKKGMMDYTSEWV